MKRPKKVWRIVPRSEESFLSLSTSSSSPSSFLRISNLYLQLCATPKSRVFPLLRAKSLSADLRHSCRGKFLARAHALGDGNSRDGSGRARARDETVGAHPKKKKNQFFVVEVDWKKLENLLLKVSAISIRSRWNCFRKKMWFSVSATDLHLTFIFSTWVGLESGKVQRLRSQWITLDRQIV